jgi:hypothetical protein
MNPDRKTLVYITAVAVLGGLAGGMLGVIWHFPPVAIVALSVILATWATALYCFSRDLE